MKDDILAVICGALDGDGEFHKRLLALDAGVYVFGHSHTQWHKQYGDKYFINPGSCGFPIDYAGGAPYTILDVSNGAISIEERRIPYDESRCARDLLDSSLYRHEKVWNELIIEEFETHREILSYFLAFVEEYANRIGDNTRPYSKQTWAEAYAAWRTVARP